MILTTLGIILGMPLGKGMGSWLMSILKMPSIYFADCLKPISYLYATGMTIIFAIAVNMITDFLNNLDEDKAEELKKVINETVDKPVKDDAKQYGIMFDKLQKADSKTFSKILNVLAKEDELHEELELIASNCPSIMAKTVIRSAIKEAKEEH